MIIRICKKNIIMISDAIWVTVAFTPSDRWFVGSRKAIIMFLLFIRNLKNRSAGKQQTELYRERKTARN